ncbi:hypothetical protein P9265_18840 [Schinkia azotoformans]|uniref:hypothetical protein n=1 Tax=Schinkia azotoformans TaxID=1454 RepID=UPI002E1F8A94|nr:hypothetical protein [Schinkia azotoformans]
MNDRKIKGRPKEVSDEKLKEMALAIKHKYGSRKLTFQFLQNETGIGRQTWKRRIEDYINELNKPIILTDMGAVKDIFFPNIEEIFEKHKNNNQKIIQELSFFEQMFRQIYQELSETKKKLTSLEGLPEVIKKQEEELKSFQKKADHYENLYKTLVITSAFSHLRENKGIEENLIQFKPEIPNNTSLEDRALNAFYETKASTDDKQMISSMFPELFSDE